MQEPMWVEKEEELVLPQTVIGDIVNDIQDLKNDEMDIPPGSMSTGLH